MTATDKIKLLPGDMREVLATLPTDSIDACVTDPPYHLASIVKRFGKECSAPAQFGKDGAYARASRGFMGKEWDGGEIAFEPETWAAVLRVLKPGAHLLAFGAPKNFGFMQNAIALGGFEVRDVIAWLFGSGFPKSHNAGNGWGTALKPAYEPVILARKPLSESTVAANILKWGTGALNIDGCRVETQDRLLNHRPTTENKTVYGDFAESYDGGGRQYAKDGTGRWPANVIHDGSDEVVAAFPADAPGQGGSAGHFKRSGEGWGTGNHIPNQVYIDVGSAARFFYTAKADSDDRLGSKHPTVKPLDLMQYLVRMVTPKGGVVLDPFAGTGTTGEAAWREGFSAVLIEREPEYQADIRRRIALCLAGPEERRNATIKEKLRDAPEDHGPLFAEIQ